MGWILYILASIITTVIMARIMEATEDDFALYFVAGIVGVCSPIVLPMIVLGFVAKLINEYITKKFKKL